MHSEIVTPAAWVAHAWFGSNLRKQTEMTTQGDTDQPKMPILNVETMFFMHILSL